jgi:hypothetical protein
MVQYQSPPRQELEDFWRAKLDKATADYREAQSRIRQALDLGRFERVRALQQVAAARAECFRLLRVVDDLVLHGKVPE